MAVLYGLFSNQPSPHDHVDLQTVEEISGWPGAIVHRVHFRNFQGGLILHPSFHSSLSEFLFTDPLQQALVLMSGYFYNRNELLNLLDLQDQGVTNPELALRLFRHYGKDFADRINGDFTLVLYRPEPDQLLIVRDHLGIRPLSYTLRERTFWFSSDGLGLCKALYGREKAGPEFLLSFLKNQEETDLNLLPSPEAKKLQPGSCLEVSEEMKVLVSRYWFPEKIRENARLDYQTACEELGGLLRDAVKARSDERFTAGTHLSGGLDSGIVAALSRQPYLHQPVFKGFSWSPGKDEFPLQAADERLKAEETGRKCSIEPVFLNFTGQDYEDLYANWRYVRGSFNEAIVRKRARQENVDLLFSGWGGDEFISLNHRGTDSDLFFKGQWKLFLLRHPLNRPRGILRTIAEEILLPALGINRDARKDKKRCWYRYLKPESSGRGLKSSPLYRWRSRRDVHLGFLRFGHLAERAEDWFINGYRDGVEYRYPLLDKRIVEYMLKIPSRILVKKGYDRLMLRGISHNILPDSVTWSKSKDDPVRYEKAKKLSVELFRDTLPQLEEFKKDPDLGFVDFKELETDIGKLPSDRPGDEIPDCVVFTLMLKQLHGFTQGYYHK